VNISKLLLIAFIIFPINAFSALEVAFDFGYNKQIYGVSRQNSCYLFDLTAIDLNYSNNLDITSQNDRYINAIAGYDVVAQQNRMLTNVYGLGLKQMLAGRNSRIVPIISAGYAREFVTSAGDITFENNTTKAQTRVNLTESKQRYNSVFGAFILQIKLTERFSLKGSVKTLFPAFEFSKARDNLKYSAGFSWIF
jgi:hypothetical protein